MVEQLQESSSNLQTPCQTMAENCSDVGLSGNVRRQFDKAADLIALAPAVRKILSTTMNEIVVHFPVKLDDGPNRNVHRLPGSAQ